ncbi:MAG TPA: VOC family protein [Burkholderiales bacterium]|nr:VOC family protein [Burkholderiales bacterium]
MTAADIPFDLRKIGHVVLRVTDLARSVEFYTRVLGFRVSDVYAEDMMPGGMVFMRFGADHHGVALVGGMEGPSQGRELHHFAFEVASLDDVFRDPDGHWLEIYWGLDQVRPDGAVRPSEQWDWAHTLEEAIDRPVPGQRAVLRDPSLREDK